MLTLEQETRLLRSHKRFRHPAQTPKQRIERNRRLDKIIDSLLKK